MVEGELIIGDGGVRRMVSRQGIGLRLLALIVMFSSLVTLVATLSQLYLDYRQQVGAIQSRMDEIERSYAPSLAAGLWNVDHDQIRLQLEGILRLPDIRAVRIRELVQGGNIPLTMAVGQANVHAPITREIPITHTVRGVARPVGVFTLEATLDDVYDRLINTTMVILISQGIKTFLVSMFILFIFYRLVTRHLIAIADYLGWHDPRSAPPRLVLDRGEAASPDELDRMVEAFNGMSGDLHAAYCELAGVNAELERDIALRQGYEEQLYRQAHYDELTGLPNRVLTLDRLNQAIAVAHRRKLSSALLLIDLDNFKNVNDTIGHEAGDRLLREAARRLGECVREDDTLARMGGDEFVIILPGIDDTFTVRKVAERVVETFSQPFTLDGSDHFVTTSIGIALFPTDGSTAQDLLRNADLALYKAKEQGRNRYQFFLPEINERIQQRLTLEGRLRGAVGRGEFVLHYQPIFEARSGHVVALETLIRWRQPDGSLAMPGSFIAQAEEIGLIVEIGDWVLETACRDAAGLFAGRAENMRVAINVSPRQLHAGGFGQRVRQVLTETGLRPEQLEIEITESILMDDTAETSRALEMISDLGVRLSIDDFGTGYSSLSYLQRYPFDTLKIDRSFVIKMADGDSGARLVETIIAMARGLRLEIIAEGVETEAQRAFLTERGCDLLQGYLLGRPAPLDSAREVLGRFTKSAESTPAG
jgi:diguanylate cyclase (GGDEF)-like protein